MQWNNTYECICTHATNNMPIPAIAWQGLAKLFQSWGPFLKNMYLTLCQFSKKDLIRYVLWKVSNFGLIFYVMSVLHKKSRQSLRHSTESFRWDFLLIIGTHIVKGLTKNVPLIIVWDSSLAPLTALTIKVVYLISKSWYG